MCNKESIRNFIIISILTTASVFSQTNFFASFDGTKIAYLDEGYGEPVLLIHGFINTKNSWDNTELKKDLLAKGYRVISLDLRGNGESDKPQDENAYSNNAEVRDVMALMDELEFKRYKAIGYSRGSIVLAELLTQDKRIKKAVLGGMGIDFSNPEWPRRILFADAFNGKVTEETKGAVAYAKSINADLRSLHLQQKYQPSTSKIDLAKIKKKVLVIAGDLDLDNGNPEELQKVLPNGTLRIVEGNHNGTYKTKPFSNAVLTFLKK